MRRQEAGAKLTRDRFYLLQQNSEGLVKTRSAGDYIIAGISLIRRHVVQEAAEKPVIFSALCAVRCVSVVLIVFSTVHSSFHLS